MTHHYGRLFHWSHDKCGAWCARVFADAVSGVCEGRLCRVWQNQR